MHAYFNKYIYKYTFKALLLQKNRNSNYPLIGELLHKLLYMHNTELCAQHGNI